MPDLGEKRDTLEQLPYDGRKKFSAPARGELPGIPAAERSLPIFGLHPEWVVILPGLLFSHGMYTADPLEEWYAINEAHKPLQRLPFRDPIYRGGTGESAKMAVACRADAWPKLAEFLGSLSSVSRDGRRYSNAFLHRVILRPETAKGARWFSVWRDAVSRKVPPLSPPTPIPVIPWAVGVKTDAGEWYVDSGTPPTVQVVKPDGR